MEKILKACIKTNTGTLHQWSSHSQIIHWATIENLEQILEWTKGFITTKQRFVDRRVAALIAFQAKQIKTRVEELQSYMI